MVSSNLRMAQFAAVKRVGDDASSSAIDTAAPHHANRFLRKEAAIALNLIMDSFLLLNVDGEIVLSNSKADQLLQKIQAAQAKSGDETQPQLPEAVIRACQLLLQNCEIFSKQSLPPQAVLTVYPEIQLRISMFGEHGEAEPLFLIGMEDKRQTSVTQATVDQWLYGLTKREKEVWALRLQDYAYQDIADELYLSLNTVKKHMKTILAKQEEWRYRHFALAAS